MSTKPVRNNPVRKIPLQRYWTTRYVITLAIGLVVVAIISALWIRHTTFENRLNMMEFMAEETANQMVQSASRRGIDQDQLMREFEIRQFLKDPGKYMQMNSDPLIFLVDAQGDVLYSNTSTKGLNQKLNPTILYQDETQEKFYSEEYRDNIYMIKKPIQTKNVLIGWVVFFELKGNLTAVDQEYKQLLIMIGALALLGWLAIYLLSRRLSKPITDVASAAERIKEGNYDIQLPENVREKEVHDLIHSFKEMTEKLAYLEKLRTELLAGVTHELKTPVTSISGLLQAVRDGVVEGEEAQDFIEVSLKETEKMERMVEDLLAFNSFVAKSVPLSLKLYDINQLTKDIVYEWKVIQKEDIKIAYQLLDRPIHVKVDAIRLKQIMVNLLTNATQAMQQIDHKQIDIVLNLSGDMVMIDVIDRGIGIPSEEENYIFERFYRGEQKKFQISGFGLGLPFSKLIAQALDGDLMLYTNDNCKTTFRILLPFVQP